MPRASVSKLPAPETPKMVSPNGVVYTLEFVTPALAEQWLTKNTDNRRQRRPVSERYARDMESGNWREGGGAMIAFAQDGTLLNGQHTLNAVVISGATVLLLVIRDLPSATQDVMDDLSKRTAGDTFGFHGIESANAAAAVVRRVLMWQAGARSNSGASQPTKTEMLEAWRNDASLTVAVDAAQKMSRRKMIPASIIGLTWWLFADIDADDCIEFWNQLGQGIGLTEGAPAHNLREQIRVRNDQSGRISETEYLAWVIKAWNHFRADRNLSPRYRYSLKPGERMPEPR